MGEAKRRGDYATRKANPTGKTNYTPRMSLFNAVQEWMRLAKPDEVQRVMERVLNDEDARER